MVGQFLGHYEIEKKLGAGGMGDVYLAEDQKLHRRVALKVLPPELAETEEGRARFQREAEAVAALDHPNIVTVFSVEEADGVHFITMELVKGRTLAELLSGKGVSRKKFYDIALALADALACAHERGIVHRDLKPSNVMLTDDGKVKVLDFGLASMKPRTPAEMTDSDESTLLRTREHVIVGTIPYMSPEQVRGEHVDARSDVFSLGTVLVEMLTGRSPFRRETPVETCSAILNDDPLAEPGDSLPASLIRALRHSIEKRPETRFQSMRDFAFVLEEASLDSGATTRVSRFSRTWAVASLALGAIAASAFFLSRPAEEPARRQLSILAPPGVILPDEIPRISPDGRYLAFAGTDDSGTRLWLRPLDEPSARALPGTEGAFKPFWSPDSRFLAYFDDGKLMKIDIQGGAPETICPSTNGHGGAWNRDGVILFSPDIFDGLYTVPAAGGTPKPLIEVSGGYPQFLPDGRHFLFGASGDMRLGSLDRAETSLVVEGYANYGHPGFLLRVTDDALLAQRFDTDRLETVGEPFPFGPAIARPSFVSAISVSDTGVLAYRTPARQMRQLTWLDRTGTELDVVTVPGEPVNIRLSPDGTRIAYQHQGDIWIVDAEGGDPSRFTFGSGAFATWSPDGRSLAYSNPEQGIFRNAPGSASPPELLLNLLPEGTSPNDWSPDGRFLVFRSRGEKRIDTDLKVLPLSPAGEPFAIGESVGVHETHGDFSPDGRFVAYASTETGRFEVFVQPFPPTGRKWQVSHRGGFLPRWRKDGGELFYIAADGHLMAVPIVTSPDRFEPETPEALFQTYVNFSRTSEGHYDVSPDGTRFLVNSPVRDPAPVEITVVLNWSAGLER